MAFSKVAPPNAHDLAHALINQIVDATGQPPVYSRGQLWVFCKSTYVAQTQDHIVKELLAFHRNDASKVAGETITVDYAFAQSAWSALTAVTNDPTFFDEAKAGVAFGNGFAAVANDGVTLLSNGPENRATAQVDGDFINHARPLAFLQLLNEIFQDDLDVVDRVSLIREFTAAALLRVAPRFEKCLLLYGESGNNGKSVMLKALETVFKTPNISSVSPDKMGDEKYVAMLAGSSLNFVHEIKKTKILDSTNLKAIISGQPVIGRYMRGNPFRFTPNAAHMFSCNALPSTNDVSGAFWRRFLVLELTHRFEGTRDMREVLDPIADEAASVLSWALAGAGALLRRGAYTIPASSVRHQLLWRVRESSAKMFWTTRVERDASAKMKLGKIYDAYVMWCEDQGVTVVTKAHFSQAGAEAGYDKTRDKTGTLYRAKLMAVVRLVSSDATSTTQSSESPVDVDDEAV